MVATKATAMPAPLPRQGSRGEGRHFFFTSLALRRAMAWPCGWQMRDSETPAEMPASTGSWRSIRGSNRRVRAATASARATPISVPFFAERRSRVRLRHHPRSRRGQPTHRDDFRNARHQLALRMTMTVSGLANAVLRGLTFSGYPFAHERLPVPVEGQNSRDKLVGDLR